jgi:hypothetical protein
MAFDPKARDMAFDNKFFALGNAQRRCRRKQLVGCRPSKFVVVVQICGVQTTRAETA